MVSVLRSCLPLFPRVRSRVAFSFSACPPLAMGVIAPRATPELLVAASASAVRSTNVCRQVIGKRFNKLRTRIHHRRNECTRIVGGKKHEETFLLISFRQNVFPFSFLLDLRAKLSAHRRLSRAELRERLVRTSAVLRGGDEMLCGSHSPNRHENGTSKRRQLLSGEKLIGLVLSLSK